MNRKHKKLIASLSAMFLLLAFSQPLFGQDNPLKSSAEAPNNMRRWAYAKGGAYFVKKELLDQYDSLRTRVEQVRADLRSGKLDSKDVSEELKLIQAEIETLRKQIEEEKVLVQAFEVYSQKSEEVFPLGKEELVVINGDRVKVRGWGGPGIKVVIEKTIIANEEPTEETFAAIRVDHQLGVAANLVGKTQAQSDASAQEYLSTPDGLKLTPLQRENYLKVVDEIHSSYDVYEQFQGKELNQIQLLGLDFKEGNRNLSLEIKSPDGEGFFRSEWQRDAQMTVYLPPCQAVAIRGCKGSYDIKEIDANLVLTGHDSRDRDYNGSFKIQDIRGNVSLSGVPINSIERVHGNLEVALPVDLANSSTSYGGIYRTSSFYAPMSTRIDTVHGDVKGVFVRSNLEVSSIDGTVDILNEFGSTQLVIDQAKTEGTHLIRSQSGSIEVRGAKDVLKQTPLYAYTECGRLQTNLRQDTLDDLSITTGIPTKGWHGFVQKSAERFDFSRFERPGKAWNNEPRAAGFDLISRAGTVTIAADEE